MQQEPLTHHFSNRRCASFRRGDLLNRDWDQVDCLDCVERKNRRRAFIVASLVLVFGVSVSLAFWWGMSFFRADEESLQPLLTFSSAPVSSSEAFRAPMPTRAPVPTQTPLEQAASACDAYQTLMEYVSVEARRTRNQSLLMFRVELGPAYNAAFEKYCSSESPPAYADFLTQIRPETRFGIAEDADLGGNARLCLDFYYEVHRAFLGALVGILKGEDWMPEVADRVLGIDHGGEVRGGFISGTMGEICPGLLARASAKG